MRSLAPDVIPLWLLLVVFLAVASVGLGIASLAAKLDVAQSELEAAQLELEAVRASCAQQRTDAPVIERVQLPSGKIAVMRQTAPGELHVEFE